MELPSNRKSIPDINHVYPYIWFRDMLNASVRDTEASLPVPLADNPRASEEGPFVRGCFRVLGGARGGETGGGCSSVHFR